MAKDSARAPEVQVTVAELETDPHPALARMRAAGPAAWVPALGAWMVTGYGAAVKVLRDARTFTVDDPRFSTAKVVGPSMLSLDGAEHARHRAPFNRAFRRDEVHARLAAFTRAEAARLVAAIEADGAAELRRAVAGPLAVTVMAEVLGLGREAQADPARILGWYDGIVAAVQADAAGTVDPAGPAAFGELTASLREVFARPGTAALLAQVAGPLTEAEAVSNAAVLMFGGIETTEGMIANALLHLLSSPGQLAPVLDDLSLVPAVIEESLRLEPAAAVVDRYATAGTRLGDAEIQAGDQVTVSIAGANRDPAVFGDPDLFDVRRPNADRHLAFAHGPHFCLGAHLARLEAQIAVETVLARLHGLHLDPRYSSAPRGLVFRKPPDLRARWSLRLTVPAPGGLQHGRAAIADGEQDAGAREPEPPTAAESHGGPRRRRRHRPDVPGRTSHRKLPAGAVQSFPGRLCHPGLVAFSLFPATACWQHRGARSGFEVACFQTAAGGWRLDGTTTAIEDGQAWIVTYSIQVDAAWLTREARVTTRTASGPRQAELVSDGAGHWLVDGRPAAHLDGCLDIDLESSALTNTLPVHRLELAPGSGAEPPAAYVRAPDLRAERLEQIYARLPHEARQQRYRYAAPAFGFTCTLGYDESGLILDYPGIAVRAG